MPKNRLTAVFDSLCIKRLLCYGVLTFLFFSHSFSQSPDFLDYDSLLEKDLEKAAIYLTEVADCSKSICQNYYAESLLKYAKALNKKNRYDSALSSCKKYIAISDKDHGEVYRVMAIAHLEMADYPSAKACLYTSITINQRVSDHQGEARCYNLLGIVSRREGKLDSALVFYDKAAKIYKEVPNQELIALDLANIYKNRGVIYYNIGLYEQSLKNYNAALAIEEDREFMEGLCKTYLNCANVYRAIKKTNKYKDYHNKAIVLAEKLNQKLTLAIAYNNYGNYYAEDMQSDSCTFFFRRSLDIAQQINNTYYEALAHHNLGNYFREHQQVNSAKYHFKESLRIRRKVGDQKGELSTMANLGALYSTLDDPRAEKILEESFRKAMELRFYDEQINALEFLIIHYNKKRHFDRSVEYYEALRVARDSLNNQDFYNRISAVETQFAVSNYQNQLEIKETELVQNSKINKLLIAVILLFTGIVGFLVFFFYKLKNYSIKLEEKNTKIDTLMRELHHRVKNNLQVISSLLGLQSMRLEDEKAKKAVEDGKSRVRAMSLIHQRLYKQEDATSINAKEYIENLLAELTTTYGYHGKITTELDLADINLDVDRTLPLGLILNELISNSFKYAYQDIDKPILKLQLITEDRKGKLTISDNGKGFQTPFNVQEAKSFGLRLVNILTEQLKGTLQVSYQDGLKYELDFNLD